MQKWTPSLTSSLERKALGKPMKKGHPSRPDHLVTKRALEYRKKRALQRQQARAMEEAQQPDVEQPTIESVVPSRDSSWVLGVSFPPPRARRRVVEEAQQPAVMSKPKKLGRPRLPDHLVSARVLRARQRSERN
eukprot:scaffold289_cov147-Amphora_coffeaeformis.AAC.2